MTGPFRNGNRRWNLMIGIGILVFSVWIVIVVLSSIFGRNQKVSDDALLIGAAGGFLAVLLGQVRHDDKINDTDEEIKRLSEKIDELLERKP